MSLQFRRGIEAARTSVTPAAGEPLYTTDDKKLYIGDGTTPGGIAVPAAANPQAVLVFGATSVTGSTTTRFLYPSVGGARAAAASVTALGLDLPIAGTLRRLRIRHNTPTGSGTITYTVMVNGVASALTIGVGAGTASGANTTDTVSVVAGDLITVRVTKALALTGTGVVEVVATFEVS